MVDDETLQSEGQVQQVEDETSSKSPGNTAEGITES